MRTKIKSSSALFLVVFAILLPPAASAAQDQVLVNGKIFTANPLQPYAEAVSIRDGKILAVGNRHDVDASVGGDARVIDLGGKMLLPGLIDSHVHAVLGGVSQLSADAKNDIAN